MAAPRTKKVQTTEKTIEPITKTEEINNNDIMLLFSEMKKEIEKLKIENEILKSNKKEEKKDDPNRLVTIIHMDDLVPGLSTIVKGDSEYYFSLMGDKHRLRFGELEKIMKAPNFKYKKLFMRGILIFGKDDQDVYEYFSIPKSDSLTVENFKNISKMNYEDLGRLYQSVSDVHKELILRHWALQCKDNPNRDYVDLNKLNILNTLSDGQLQHIISDIGNIKLV